MQASRRHVVVSIGKGFDRRSKEDHPEPDRVTKVKAGFGRILLEEGFISSSKKMFSFRKEGCEKCEFLVHEVYALDILISTGEGKPKESEVRTTVYKKKNIIYQLRMKTSRAFLSEAEKKYNLMPFTLRAFEDEKKARLGVIECAKHDLMEPYPVYYEKDGEFVAEFKYTVLLMPNGTMKITGLPLEIENFQTENQIVDEAIKVGRRQNKETQHWRLYLSYSFKFISILYL
jgi:hypothetical protein